MNSAILDELVTLYHAAAAARDTLAEAIERQAGKHEVSRSALRKVVAALAQEKADDLNTEAAAILELLAP